MQWLGRHGAHEAILCLSAPHSTAGHFLISVPKRSFTLTFRLESNALHAETLCTERIIEHAKLLSRIENERAHYYIFSYARLSEE